MGVFELYPKASGTKFKHCSRLLQNSLGFGPLGIILSSLLRRFTDGYIVLNELNPLVLLNKISGGSSRKVFLCKFTFCKLLLVQYFDVIFDYPDNKGMEVQIGRIVYSNINNN